MARFELGDLIWRIKGDSSDYDKKIQATSSKLTKFGDRAKKVGKSLSTFVTAPLVGFGVAGVKAASDLEESLNAVNVVFGESADIVNRFGEDAAENVGLSQAKFNELATTIGSQLKQSGLEIDTVANQTNELTTRAADLASVFNTSVDEALGALGSALRGEAEPARRFGVNISEAAIQSEALASGLVESKDQIDEQIKVQARYNLIMKQSDQVAGDFENTSDSLANQTRILKSDLVDVAAELGEQLIPIATDMIGTARDLVGWFGDLSEGSQRTVLGFGGLAAAIGPALVGIGSITKAIAALNTTVLFGPVGLIAGVVAAGVALATFSEKGSESKKSVTGVSGGYADLRDKAAEARGELDEGNESIEEAGEKSESTSESIDKMGGSLRRAAREQRDLRRAFQEDDRERTIDAIREEAVALDNLAAQGLFPEIELLERKIALRQEEIDTLKAKAIEEGDVSEATLEQIEIQEASIQRYRDRIDVINDEEGAIEDSNEATEVNLELLDELTEQIETLNDVQGKQLGTTIALKGEYFDSVDALEEQERAVDNLTSGIEKYAAIVAPVFETIGEVIASNEKSWEDLGKSALSVIANIVRAIGQELLAQAAAAVAQAIIFPATATYKLPGAAKATAASAAAFIAAGIIEGLSQNFAEGGFVQPRPGTPETGDRVPARLNPREVVLTESDANELLSAIRGGGLGGKSSRITVNLDRKTLLDAVTKGSDNGEVIINSRAVR